jgi:hypothetical protein
MPKSYCVPQSMHVARCSAKMFGEKGIGRSDLLNVYSIALETEQKLEQAGAAASEADRVGTPDPRFQQEDRDLLRGRLVAAQGRVEDSVSYLPQMDQDLRGTRRTGIRSAANASAR